MSYYILYRAFEYSFQHCLQNQGKVSFSGLAIVTSCNIYLLIKPIPAQPHFSLNYFIGIVSISLSDCPVYIKDWSDCENDLFPCLVDYTAVSAQSYTIPPRGHCQSWLILSRLVSIDLTFPMTFILTLSDHIDPSPISVRNGVWPPTQDLSYYSPLLCMGPI